MRAMVAPNRFHGAIEQADPDRTRKLWRIDTLGGAYYLLILSQEKLELTSVAEQFGFDADYECKPYDKLLGRIVNGSRWQFRLRANPTVQKYDETKGRGQVMAHITPAHQGEWLQKQSGKYGFSLNDGEWLVTESKWYRFKKNRNSEHTVRLLSVTFEGMLTVTDAEMFRKALTDGIGREKAFGMGLLTIAGGRP